MLIKKVQFIKLLTVVIELHVQSMSIQFKFTYLEKIFYTFSHFALVVHFMQCIVLLFFRPLHCCLWVSSQKEENILQKPIL